jgi:hypothetical protein
MNAQTPKSPRQGVGSTVQGARPAGKIAIKTKGTLQMKNKK